MKLETPTGILKTNNKIIGINGILFEVLPKSHVFKYRLLMDCFIDTNIFPLNDIETKFIILEKTGKLNLKRGFLSDGATGFPDIESIIRAAFFHDALFWMIMKRYIDKRYIGLSNLVFRNICKEDRMNKINRFLTYLGLKLFSRIHIEKVMRKLKETLK